MHLAEYVLLKSCNLTIKNKTTTFFLDFHNVFMFFKQGHSDIKHT